MEEKKIGVLEIIETMFVCLSAVSAVIGMFAVFLENYQLSTIAWVFSSITMGIAYVIKDKHNK